MLELNNNPPIGYTFDLNRNSEQSRGLRAWYPMVWSRGAGKVYNRAYDYAGTGTLSSANSWSNLPTIASALEFDGSTSAGINAGANPTHRFSDVIACFAWIYPRAVPANNNSHMIMSVCDNITTSGWEFAHRNTLAGVQTYLGYAYYNGGVRGWYVGSSILMSANNLYHVGFVHRGAVLDFYVNGVLDSSQAVDGTAIVYAGDSTRLGDQTQNFEFNGGIGDIRLYNRYFSAREVEKLYNPQTRWELYKPLQQFWQGFAATGGDQTATINASAATGVGLQLSALPGNLDRAINLASGEGVGLGLSTNYTQEINSAVSSGVGYQLTFSVGNVDAAINAAVSSAIGYNPSTNYIQTIEQALATALGYQVSFTTGNVNVSINSSGASGLGYEVNFSTGNDASVNAASASGVGYQPTTLTGNVNISVNLASATALGYQTNFTVGDIIVSVNYAIANAIGRNAVAGDFVIILSPDRTYRVIADNRTYTPFENRIFIAKEN